ALANAGVDLLIIETISSLKMMTLAVEAARQVCDLPVIAQMTVTEEGSTMYGDEPEEIASFLKTLNVDVGGLNCSVGPQMMLGAIKRMAEVDGMRLSAQPNAGQPKLVEGRYLYLCSPEYMAEYARRFVAAGVSIVGGCCGTTPEHIRAIATAIKSTQIDQGEFYDVQIEMPAEELEKASTKRKPTRLEKMLTKQFVVSVEIDPPRGISVQRVIDNAKMLKDNGIYAVNIADGPRASARMSPLVLGHIIERSAKIQTIIHFCCRDRNLIALQADLMAAYVGGLRNLLIVTGDPPKLGDYPSSTAIFDVDSIGLVKIARNLNLGLDLAGKPISKPTHFHLGVGVNPGAIEMEKELSRYRQKRDAGAHFAMTQPVYESRLFEEFIRETRDVEMPVFVGILPLISYRNAEFLHNEVPGMSVPAPVRQRMREARTAEAAKKEGIAIASDALSAVVGMERVVGAYIIPPFGHIDLAVEIAKNATLI
ncbi:bifunctional homocysteine S-methyltransferase/methylenetetrahydrofolate reductase, partial [bacterium]|nr:bifunctional homocysteine S-methyltransferase/methylenetetrahydrofolate reductase [bacterium]